MPLTGSLVFAQHVGSAKAQVVEIALSARLTDEFLNHQSHPGIKARRAQAKINTETASGIVAFFAFKFCITTGTIIAHAIRELAIKPMARGFHKIILRIAAQHKKALIGHTVAVGKHILAADARFQPADDAKAEGRIGCVFSESEIGHGAVLKIRPRQLGTCRTQEPRLTFLGPCRKGDARENEEQEIFHRSEGRGRGAMN